MAATTQYELDHYNGCPARRVEAYLAPSRRVATIHCCDCGATRNTANPVLMRDLLARDPFAQEETECAEPRPEHPARRGWRRLWRRGRDA